MGCDVPVLFDSPRRPVSEGDLPVGAATGDSDRAALLLRAVDPIGETTVRRHVIKLRGGLVVPGAPACAPIEADRPPLIAAQRDDFRIRRIDPDALIVVPSGRALDPGERAPPVGRPIGP